MKRCGSGSIGSTVSSREVLGKLQREGESVKSDIDSETIADRLYGYENAQYDQNAKSFLASRKILAEILKRTVPEFQAVSMAQIAEECIEGTPRISTIPVHPDKSNAVPQRIRGDRNEDGSPTEGYVTYDILFHARVPASGECITLIINIEAQRTQSRARLRYALLRRAVFYACRLISSQKETEFAGSDYDGIKKVYTIWICMDSPNGQSIINRYSLNEKHLLHRYKEDRQHYDLLNIVMICLGERADKDRLIHLLQVLFTESKKSAEQKKEILNEEYGIELTEDMEKELRTMCNLSLGIAEKAYDSGIEQGIERGIEQGMKTGIQRGADRLGRLMGMLLQDGKIKEATKAAEDEATRQRLYREYGIEP